MIESTISKENGSSIILAAIKVPTEIEKLPRIFDAKWNAQEKRNFLFFYSVPALRQLLRPEFYRHWLLLVNAIRLVSKKEFPDEAIDIAFLLANEFALQTERLYGVQHNSYNIHVFIHAINCVRKWGAPWVTSAFMYESEIAKIKRYYHGSKSPEKQIFGYSMMRNKLREFSGNFIPFSPDGVQDLYKNWMDQSLPTLSCPIFGTWSR